MRKTQNNALAMKLNCKCVAVVRLQMIFSELLKSKMETPTFVGGQIARLATGA